MAFALALVATAASAQPGPTEGQAADQEDFYALVAGLECADVSLACQQAVPTLFYEGWPDSLVNLLSHWEDVCGPAEPITRTLILGAIWDGAFDESLYGDEVMDFLIWYGDAARRDFPDDPGRVDPDLASGGVASPADFTEVRDQYDAFTRDLADQLLPHTAGNTPERFFCLFYAGQRREAWRLLEGEALRGTYLKRQYEWELERIALQRASTNLMVTTGFWMPSGNLALAGDHFFVGLMGEQRRQTHFLRLAGELLLGRSKYPYTVNQSEGTGRSDRFTAASFLVEAGISPVRRGAASLHLFAGLGLDWLKPFLAEDALTDVSLLNAKGLVGLGCRVGLGRFQRYFVGLDLRREWMGDRNRGGTPLDGRAWSFRLGFGLNRNSGLDRRLTGLGRPPGE